MALQGLQSELVVVELDEIGLLLVLLEAGSGLGLFEKAGLFGVFYLGIFVAVVLA